MTNINPRIIPIAVKGNGDAGWWDGVIIAAEGPKGGRVALLSLSPRAAKKLALAIVRQLREIRAEGFEV